MVLAVVLAAVVCARGEGERALAQEVKSAAAHQQSRHLDGHVAVSAVGGTMKSATRCGVLRLSAELSSAQSPL